MRGTSVVFNRATEQPQRGSGDTRMLLTPYSLTFLAQVREHPSQHDAVSSNRRGVFVTTLEKTMTKTCETLIWFLATER
jgi:hypothetical protein